MSENSPRLGVLLAGLGAVSTTFIAGVEAIRRGLGAPVGSFTQLGRIEREPNGEGELVRNLVDLTDLGDLVFGAWDVIADDCATAARRAGVLDPQLLDRLQPFLSEIRPMPAAFDPAFVRRLSGDHRIPGGRRTWAKRLRRDIAQFKADNSLERVVVVWAGSTEVYQEPGVATRSLERLEAALDSDDPTVPPSLIYAYAALKEGCPFANASPNLAADVPAIRELAEATGLPVAGKDLKTGQTLLKTILAPGLRARSLGVHGWFSTNILGNRDGEILADAGSFKSKEVSKLSVLDEILRPDKDPTLYGDLQHEVRINYYRPRGDNKEGWDNIDIFGWLGMPMQIKVNFLCRDSILAAPIVLDLVLLLDLAQRSGKIGTQEWLSFFFKSPMHEPGTRPVHDLFRQLDMLEREVLSLNESRKTRGGRRDLRVVPTN